MNEQEVQRRLQEVAERLERIEAVLGLRTRPQAAAPVTPAAPSVVEEPKPGPPAPAVAVPPVAAKPPFEMAPMLEPARSATQGPAPLRSRLGPTPADADAGEVRKRRPVPLEVLIGERWMAWAGAIVVVAAVGFFVKLAHDLGWWGQLPPLTRSLLCAGFGVALVIAGEVALRRIGRVAAVSLYGAGLGTLYLTAYATFRYLDLVSQAGAFWLMGAVALLGVGLTLRGRMLVIGILSLLGGYLSPVLLSEQVTFAAALPLYVTALLAIALILSATLPVPFRPLRYVGLGLHVVVATLWLWQEGRDHWLLAMTFLTLWWAVTVAEALAAALRDQSARGNAVAALLMTSWYATAGCGVLAAAQPGERDWLGVFVCAVGAVSAWAALAVGPGLRVLRGRPRRPLELMTTTLWLQVGVLVATAIGLQFRSSGESYGQSIGWIVMGVACVELGRRLPSRGVEVFGLLVGAAGIGRVWAADRDNFALRTTLWAVGSVEVTGWVLLAIASAVATIVIARRLRTSGHGAWRRLCVLSTSLGTLQWMIAWGICADGVPVTTAWVAAVVALLFTDRLRASHGHRSAAVSLLVVTTLKWLMLDAWGPRAASSWNAAASLPLLNWPMLAAGLVAGGFSAAWYTARRAAPQAAGRNAEGASVPDKPGAGEWHLVLGALFLLVALSFQLEHLIGRIELSWPADVPSLWPGFQVRMLWWTVLWAAGGVGCLAAGWRWGLRGVLNLGWILTCAAGVVWLIGGALNWRLDRGVVLCPTLLNVQFFTGLVVATFAALAYLILKRTTAATWWGETASAGAQATLLASVLLLLVALSLEVERRLAHVAAGRLAGQWDWPPVQARLLWWTLLWAVGGLGTLMAGWWRGLRVLHHAGWALVVLCAGAWLTMGTLYWRVEHGVAPCQVVVNTQFLVGLAVATATAAAAGTTRRVRLARPVWFPPGWPLGVLGVALAVMAGLWLGSLELDRYFAPEAERVSDPAMARQTALSVYGGVYAIGLVAVGFVWRSALMRYGGLGLLAVTLAKVLLVDLAHVRYIYRVLSLLAVGLLFIATSVAYAKLSARLLGGRGAADPLPDGGASDQRSSDA